MKRKQFLSILGILPPLLLMCKTDAPATTTIINCTLIDEDNKPVEGEIFQIYGYQTKGISGVPTFNEFATTDKDGKFKYEKLIPFNTNLSYISPSSSNKRYQFKDNGGLYTSLDAGLLLNMGQENTFNFKLLKK